jgi:1,4-dihydroxy-2-naphthoyl-CoA hydrolase
VDDTHWDAREMPVPLIPIERTFERYLALEWVELTADSACVRFEVREHLKQPLGLLHGGIYCAVAETIASVATIKQVWPDGLIAMGQSNAANFLRPVTAGTVEVAAALRSHNDLAWLWSHEFRDEKGRLCALAEVTVAVRPLTDGILRDQSQGDAHRAG